MQSLFSSFFSPLCDLLLLHRDLYTKKKYYALSFIIRQKKSPVRCPERSKKSMKIRLLSESPLNSTTNYSWSGNSFPCTRRLAGFLAERSSYRFCLPSAMHQWLSMRKKNLHSLITVTRSYRNHTCFPFNQSGLNKTGWHQLSSLWNCHFFTLPHRMNDIAV